MQWEIVAAIYNHKLLSSELRVCVCVYVCVFVCVFTSIHREGPNTMKHQNLRTSHFILFTF